MKRSLVFLFTLIISSGVYPLELKFIGGSNLSRYSIFPKESYDYSFPIVRYSYESSYKPGFLWGAGVEMPLAKNIAIEVDGIYFRKGSEVTQFNDDIPFLKRNYVLNVVSLPILVKIKFLPDSSPYILHGGELSYLLSHKYKWTYEQPGDGLPQEETIDIKEETKNFTFGAIVGGGFEIKTRWIAFFVEARYHFGLINIISENHNDQMYPSQLIKANSQVVLFGLKI
jgi:hypothetical protein